MNDFTSPEVVRAFIERVAVAVALGIAAWICLWLIFEPFDKDAP